MELSGAWLFLLDRDDVCFADRRDLGQMVGKFIYLHGHVYAASTTRKRSKVVGVKPSSLTSAALAKQWACNTVL